MTFSSLGIGASALFAAQRALETAAHNVANAANPAYTRQRVEITAARPTAGTAGMRGDGMRGTGVTVVAINRLRDLLSDVAYRTEASYAGAATAKSTVLSQAEEILGPFTDGAPAALSKFWAAWDQLAISPQDTAARTGVISAGQQLAQSLQDASVRLDQITADVTRKMQDDVTHVNDLASAVAKANRAVLDATTAGAAPNDLLDQRDALLDQLSTLTGATYRTEDDGTVGVFLGSRPIVRGTTTDPLTVTVTAGLPSVAFASGSDPAQVSGELGGFTAVTNVALPSFRADLDALAVGLRDTVNAAHQQGVDLAGSSGLDFFTGSSAADIGVRAGMTTDEVAASASGAAADGNNALAMAQLRSAVLGSGGTLGDGVRALAGRLGAEASSATAQANASEGAMSQLTQSRAAHNGVSVDEEMVDLVKFQHSYEAAAKVISIADEMLDTLINRMGVG